MDSLTILLNLELLAPNPGPDIPDIPDILTLKAPVLIRMTTVKPSAQLVLAMGCNARSLNSTLQYSHGVSAMVNAKLGQGRPCPPGSSGLASTARRTLHRSTGVPWRPSHGG